MRFWVIREIDFNWAIFIFKLLKSLLSIQVGCLKNLKVVFALDKAMNLDGSISFTAEALIWLTILVPCFATAAFTPWTVVVKETELALFTSLSTSVFWNYFAIWFFFVWANFKLPSWPQTEVIILSFLIFLSRCVSVINRKRNAFSANLIFKICSLGTTSTETPWRYFFIEVWNL